MGSKAAIPARSATHPTPLLIDSLSVIAIDATYVLDPQPSGVSVYSRRLIESLAELQSPDKFLISYRLSRWKLRNRAPRIPVDEPGGQDRFTTVFFQEPWTFWLPRQAELFHSLAQRPAPFHFRKEVVTVHDLFPLTSRDYSSPDFQRKFSRLLVEAVRRATRVITPSIYTAQQLCRYVNLEKDKIRVVPEGVDLPKHLLEPEARRRSREEQVGSGNELVLVVGVIQTRKNTLGALRALARLPDRYRIVLVGGDGYGSEVVHNFLAESSLGNRAIVHGHVESAVLSLLYQSASVLLFPSFEEGFGLPVLEAMAHGLPVVASSKASIPEVGGDAVLYVDPADDAQIASQVLRAVEDNGTREQMIASGYARAREFPWSKTAEKTLEVYDEALRA
jgi:glycosyltransferase involved in cell wall biosynthesis